MDPDSIISREANGAEISRVSHDNEKGARLEELEMGPEEVPRARIDKVYRYMKLSYFSIFPFAEF